MNREDAALRVERTLLGACLYEDEATLELVTSMTHPSDYYLDSHRRIAQRIFELSEANSPVNCVTVLQELQKHQEVELVGGFGYVNDLTVGLPHHLRASAQDHIDRLKEFRRLRELAALAEQMSIDASEASQDSHRIVQNTATRLEAIVGDSVTENPGVENFTVSALDEWQKERELERTPGLSFGIPDLDEATGGMMPGEQTALGAGSGVGKTTALAQALAANCSKGIPCHAFLLEPTRQQILRRLWSMVSGVRYSAAMRPWTADADEAQKLRDAAYRVAEWPLRLHDRSSITLDQVLSLGRLSINRHGTRLIALDYVQRLKIRSAEKDEPLRLRVARASTALADLVKGTNCASLLLSQLTTGRKNGAQAKPTMYDFRESSQIENDAHTIILLHRDYDEEQGHYTEQGAIFVPKQRFGSPCNLIARFDPVMALWEGKR